MTYMISEFVKNVWFSSVLQPTRLSTETKLSFEPPCYPCQVLLGIEGINWSNSGDKLAGIFGFHTKQH